MHTFLNNVYIKVGPLIICMKASQLHTDIKDDTGSCQLHWWMQCLQVRTGGHQALSRQWAALQHLSLQSLHSSASMSIKKYTEQFFQLQPSRSCSWKREALVEPATGAAITPGVMIKTEYFLWRISLVIMCVYMSNNDDDGARSRSSNCS